LDWVTRNATPALAAIPWNALIVTSMYECVHYHAVEFGFQGGFEEKIRIGTIIAGHVPTPTRCVSDDTFNFYAV
jgi:hypothetical protein